MLDIGALNRCAARTRERPLFRTRFLNRAVLAKVRDRGLLSKPDPNAPCVTEFRVPLDPELPSGPALVLPMREANVSQVLAGYAGPSAIASDDWQRDLRTLRRLCALPAFDRYLVIERLTRIDAIRGDFASGLARDASVSAARAAIRRHLEPIIVRIMDQRGTRRRSDGQAPCFSGWSPGGLSSLVPVLVRLDIAKERLIATAEAWEALAYFGWRRGVVDSDWLELTRWIDAPQGSLGTGADWTIGTLPEDAQRAREAVEQTIGDLDSVLHRYAHACTEILDHGSEPGLFTAMMDEAVALERRVGFGFVLMDHAMRLYREARSFDPPAINAMGSRPRHARWTEIHGIDRAEAMRRRSAALDRIARLLRRG